MSRGSRRGERIKTLKRRRDFLAARIASGTSGDIDFDRAECAALTWALRVLEVAQQRGLLPNLESDS